MILNDLVKQLVELQEAGHGELQVRVYAGHGQTHMEACNVGLSHICEDEYRADALHEDDLPDYPDAVPIIEITD